MKNRAALVLVAVLVAACASTRQPTTSPTSVPTSVPTSPGSFAVAPSLPAETPTAADAAPSGSVPPVSTAAWTGLRIQALTGAPIRAVSVAAWSGGYLALGPTDSQHELPAWISRDGRSWVALPAATFRSAIDGVAAPLADGVIVAVQSPTGVTTVWLSTDGLTWTSGAAPPMRLHGGGDFAGSPGGAVAILEGSPYRIAFSVDGIAWQTVPLPGDSAFSVQGVAALGTGFVAVGDAGRQAGGFVVGSPVAWWSADGRQWNLAHVQAHPGDGFVDVEAGGSGLVAISSTGGTPGLTSFWTSPDGRTWTVSTADPLGLLGDCCQAGVPGSANGAFLGDGTRIVGYGNHGTAPFEYWVSFDGARWTKLALSGDTAAAVAAAAVGGHVTPFLLRDGILFGGDQGAWFGAAR